MIDLNLRVKGQWDKVADDFGLRKEVVVEPAVIDPETGDITTPAVTETVFKDKTDGVHIDEIDTIWITPPTFDADGNELTPGAKAPGLHFNIRIDNPEVEATFADLWDITKDAEGKVIDKKVKGAKKAKANKAEAAWEYKGCEVIDMDTVATPQRVWL